MQVRQGDAASSWRQNTLGDIQGDRGLIARLNGPTQINNRGRYPKRRSDTQKAETQHQDSDMPKTDASKTRLWKHAILEASRTW